MTDLAQNTALLPAAPETSVDTLLQRALALHQADHLEEAETLYRQVLEIEPQHADVLHLLGLIAHQFGQYESASEFIMAAIERQPQAFYYFNLGNVMQAHNRPAAAAECFIQAIAMQPDYADAHNNLGNAHRALKQHEAAVESFCTALRLKPDHAQANNNLANALLELDELDAALEAYRNAIALRPDFAEPRSNLLFALNYQGRAWPGDYLDEAQRFATLALQRATPASAWQVDATPRTDRPLRVGVVSGDLKQHPVGYFMESVLAHVDPARVELIAYPTRHVEDALTQRIRARFSAWHCLAGMSDEAAASQIQADGIDLLLDASGHTTYNRLPLFAWRPAPVQVSWPGYFASTGLDSIDYILGDAHVLPEGEASHFVEKPWRLPNSYLCFTPPTDEIEVNALPALANGYVTFGCFGKLLKLTDEVIAVWSRVLHTVPESRLLLKAFELSTEYVQRKTRERFAAHGIAADRLLLEQGAPRSEYLAAYHQVDIMLSPFPYPGGTTTAEGLWMGVPVVALKGQRFLTHIAESILHGAGQAAWVAEDQDDYVAKAVAAASSAGRDALVSLRVDLRRQLLNSPLCDAPRFARDLEQALHAMWLEYVSRVAATPS
ncbi:tetratricopeptide repeat protein [Paraburkholderia bonniea]|uniref:O-linked N-acetylglucosamine transferase, SPINDLY family protein n=1 Tax=Paraburkholderia bonniea TaxID=2152891 RepID=UPI0012929015|nr:tetratricopeptide repeat protein [Paraburkholderia bonniea]WJF90394.1 tetratricopeptide repeat protein [Paraburkholderia bonniea]WJF93709.1 tetratricopeptide repeat protein [Paraburkholderia bonniea]